MFKKKSPFPQARKICGHIYESARVGFFPGIVVLARAAPQPATTDPSAPGSWGSFWRAHGNLRVYAPSPADYTLMDRLNDVTPPPPATTQYRVGDTIRRLADGEVCDEYGRAARVARRPSPPPPFSLGPPAIASPQKRLRREGALPASHSADESHSSPERSHHHHIKRSTSSLSITQQQQESTALARSRQTSSCTSLASSAESGAVVLGVSRISLADAVETSHGLRTTEHAYRTGGDGVKASSARRDPYRELFGLGELTRLFRHMVLAELEPGQTRVCADELTNNTHMLYHQSREGSGTRTLVDNLCRVHRLNLLRVYTRATRNIDGVALSIRYQTGGYARILERALELAPCVVLLDRLDTHFESMYGTTGHELMMAWDELLESRRSESVPQVWFVFSSCLSLDQSLRFVENPFLRLRNCASVSSPIKDVEAWQIMTQVYGESALAAGVILADDRPTYPSEAQLASEARAAHLEAYARALCASEYQRQVERRAPHLKRVAFALHRATQQSTPDDQPVHSPLPCWFHTVVATAFSHRADRRTDPSNEAFLEAARRLPLNFAPHIELHE